MVEQHSYGDAPLHGFAEGGEERSGGRVVTKGVVLDVEVALRGVRGRDHGCELVVEVGEQPGVVSFEQPHRAKGLVQVRHRRQPRRGPMGTSDVGQIAASFGDPVVHVLLLLAPVLRQLRLPISANKMMPKIGNRVLSRIQAKAEEARRLRGPTTRARTTRTTLRTVRSPTPLSPAHNASTTLSVSSDARRRPGSPSAAQSTDRVPTVARALAPQRGPQGPARTVRRSYPSAITQKM
jgi:hypothetical protein